MASEAQCDHDDEMITQISVALPIAVGAVLVIVLMVTPCLSSESMIDGYAFDQAEASDIPQQINVQIDAEGNLFIDAVAADDATLAARARDLVATAGESATATITADTHAEHGAVIRVMSILNHERLTRFSFNVSADALPAP